MGVGEAFIDVWGRTAVPLIPIEPRYLITQASSRYRAFAGIRLGVAL